MSNTQTASTTVDAAVAALLIPATTTAAPRSTTSITNEVPGIVVDYGDMIAQILADAEPIVESAAALGVPLLLHEIPMGVFISAWVGPTVIAGYVSQAMTALEGAVAGKTLVIANPNAVEIIALNLFRQGEPALVKLLGDTVMPLVSKLVAKALAGIAPPAPAGSSAPVNPNFKH